MDPGGWIKLKTICTHLTAARSVSGQSGAACQVSKEAVSENFRERPWTFFAAVLQYLLSAYDQLWQQLAGRPNAQMLEELQVVLVDATSLRVALQ